MIGILGGAAVGIVSVDVAVMFVMSVAMNAVIVVVVL